MKDETAARKVAYRTRVGITVPTAKGSVHVAAGTVCPSDGVPPIPAASTPWLLAQGYIEEA